MRDTYSTQEVCDSLRISRTTLHRWVARGFKLLPPLTRKPEGRMLTRRWTKLDIDRLQKHAQLHYGQKLWARTGRFAGGRAKPKLPTRRTLKRTPVGAASPISQWGKRFVARNARNVATAFSVGPAAAEVVAREIAERLVEYFPPEDSLFSAEKLSEGIAQKILPTVRSALTLPLVN